MLLNHSLVYFVARGAPAILNFLALIIYTRLLSPHEYGKYAVAYAIVMAVQTIIFQWLRLSVARLLPSHQEDNRTFNATVLYGFLFATAAAILLSAAIIPLLNSGIRDLALPSVLLLISFGWFELNVEYSRSRLQPGRYGLQLVLRALLATLLSIALIHLGLGASSILIALSLGMVIATVLFPGVRLVDFSIRQVDRDLLKKLVAYGGPLTATAALAWIISMSDRVMLTTLMDSAAAGVYAIGYDFSRHTLGTMLMIVNLAGFPLAVRALEKSGEDSAKTQLAMNASGLTLIGIPCTTTLLLLADNIAFSLFGDSFHLYVPTVIAAISVSALVEGLKSYYFDHAFFLSGNTRGQIPILIITAIANISLNFILIPLYGLLGAAIASIASYTLGLLSSIARGRSYFKMPFPRDWGKMLLAGIAMAITLLFVRGSHGLPQLILQTAAGLSVYATSLFVLDALGVRGWLFKLIAVRSAEKVD